MFTLSLSFDYFIRSGSSPSAELPSPVSATSKDVVVTVFPRWFKHVSVQWSIPDTWGHCLFNVYFSQIEDSDFNKINVTPIDGTYMNDLSTEEYRKFNEGYYIVEVLPQDQGSPTGVVKSAPVTWTTARVKFGDIRAREINRREYFLLTHFVGVKSYIFKRKTYGKRCPQCWDYKAEKVVKDHCENCFGTSFEGGYFPAIPCYFQYDASNNQEVRGYTGIQEPNSIGAWTIPRSPPRRSSVTYGGLEDV
jgi:hypothetical protein